VLRELLARFEREFAARHGLTIRFSPEAAAAIVDKALALGGEPPEIAAALLQGYEHGLELIRTHTGQREFEITREVLDRPGEALSRWIREAVSG